MKNFLIGTVFGIVVASPGGFNNITKLLDSGVNKVKSTVQEQVKE